MGNKRPIQMLFIGTLFLSLSTSSLAQQQKNDPGDAVVVTASRLEQQLTDTIPHTTVITAKDIRESQAVDLPSLLRREAGFEFVQNGGIGSASSISMRGGDGTQTLVLIDGVRVGSATLGTTAIENVMLDQVERVEIVRGNVSALYGAGAIGGVIQIFTKQGYGAPRAQVQVMAGSRDSSNVAAGYGGSLGNTHFSFNVSRFNTGGFPAIDASLAPNANPANDGYRNLSFSGQLAQQLAAGHEIGLRAYQSLGKIYYANAFGKPTDVNYLDNSLSTYSIYSNDKIASFWNSRLTMADGTDKSEGHTNGNAPTRFNTRNAQLQWQNDFTLAKDHILTAEVEGQQQRIDSTTTYAQTGRNVQSVMLAYDGRIGANQFQASTRRDHYSDFGNADTWLVGYGYDLSASWKLTAMRSSAFTAPTFNELFYPNYGNPNLQPEKSYSDELGLQYAAGNHLLRVVTFRTNYQNLIQTTAVAPGIYEAANVAQARVNGTELSYTGRLRNWDLRASLTVQHPQNLTTGAPLTRRAKIFGNVVASTSLGAWRLGGELGASATRPDTNITTGAPVTLGSYKLVNFTVRYRFDKHTFLAARLENAFDEHYMLADGYNTPPRGLFVSLGWRQ